MSRTIDEQMLHDVEQVVTKEHAEFLSRSLRAVAYRLLACAEDEPSRGMLDRAVNEITVGSIILATATLVCKGEATDHSVVDAIQRAGALLRERIDAMPGKRPEACR